MKQLEKDIFVKVVSIFTILFSLLYFISYLFVQNYIIEITTATALNVEDVMHQFHIIWLEIGGIFLLLFFIALYLIKKTLDKLSCDVKELTRYIEDISNHKTYDAILEIKHYLEFLHISITLKNIIKRLYKKDKK